MSSELSAPQIRHARPNDAAELARLLTALGHPTSEQSIVVAWRDWDSGNNAALVAVRSDGSLAGAITLHQMRVLHRPKPVGRITALIVDDAEREQGIGRALVAAAEEYLARAGCGLIEITSNERLGDAHAFYVHVGYQQTSLRFAKVLPPPDFTG